MLFTHKDEFTLPLLVVSKTRKKPKAPKGIFSSQ